MALNAEINRGKVNGHYTETKHVSHTFQLAETLLSRNRAPVPGDDAKLVNPLITKDSQD